MGEISYLLGNKKSDQNNYYRDLPLLTLHHVLPSRSPQRFPFSPELELLHVANSEHTKDTMKVKHCPLQSLHVYTI